MRNRPLTIGRLEKINKRYKPLNRFADFIGKNVSRKLGSKITLFLFDMWCKETGK